MPRLLAIALFWTALVVAGIVRADDDAPPETDEAPSFEQLVREGDRARFAKDMSAAIEAYGKALKIRNDPRIVGRIGLAALAGGVPDSAMSYLLRAIIDGHRVPLPELQQIQSAFNRTLPLVCRVDITVSHLGADVTIDGELERIGSTAGDFYVFVMPGKHEIKATLAGYHDAVINIDAKKGGAEQVSLVLTPLPSVPLNETPEPEPPPAPKCEPCERKEDWSSLEELKPKASAKEIEDAEDKRVRGQWIPGMGLTAVYGAVSPYPAAGFVLSSRWKLDSFFSTGFDFRAVMSPRGIEGYAIRGTSIALLPSLCVNRDKFTGCLSAHAGLLLHSSDKPAVSIVRPSWGGGVSLGLRFARYKSLDFNASLTGELLLDEYPLNVNRELFTLWTGQPFLTGLNITAVRNAR